MPEDEEDRHEGYRKSPEQVLEDLRSKSMEWLVREVCENHGVAALELCGFSRQAPVPAARADLWTALKVKYRWSYPRIGEVFGVDHTTVMSHVKNYKARKDRNKDDD